MLLVSLAELLWTAVGILGPLFILALYPVFERLKLCSPVLVVPGMVGLALFFYFYWGPHLQYSHFLIGAGVFLAIYLPNVYGWGYRSTDAFALAALAVLGADQMWQLPIYLDDWGKGGAALGLASAGFSMMSIPLLFYFLMRSGRTAKLDELSGCVLALALLWEGSLLSVFWVPDFDYVLFFLWAGFFLALFRSSVPTPKAMSRKVDPIAARN